VILTFTTYRKIRTDERRGRSALTAAAKRFFTSSLIQDHSYDTQTDCSVAPFDVNECVPKPIDPQDFDNDTQNRSSGALHHAKTTYLSHMEESIETQRLIPAWEYVADTVMGGMSSGNIRAEAYQGRSANVLRGDVSLDNNGGFVQIAADLNADSSIYDASDWDGFEMIICGNDTAYDFRLRTDALRRPWQSFRTDFIAPSAWQTVRLPFDQMIPHKTDAAFDPAGLRRIGILAIGRAMRAEIAVAAVHLYRS